MAASILPTTIYQNKLYFLFGKERETDNTPGWSDFGGGRDNKETHLETAIREGGEEMTGFLGDTAQIKKMVTQHGNYTLDCNLSPTNTYRVHIFPMDYNEYLPHYYNNNQRFLQKNLDAKVIQDTKIFEKSEIRWFSEDELTKKRSLFRSFYRTIVDLIVEQKEDIRRFISSAKRPVIRRTRRTRPIIRRTRTNQSMKTKI